MAYKSENIAFLYEYRTWRVLLSLVIYKDGRVKWISNNTIYGDLEAEDRKRRISDKSMARIMNILSDTARMQNFENMEEPEENWGHEAKFTLYIDNGECKVQKKGTNWQYCQGRRKLKEKYPVVADFCKLLKQLESVLKPYGVDAESCRMAHRTYVEPEEEDENPIVRTFVVYDFKKADEQRTCGDCRLEHYYFHKFADGTFEFEYQEGWFAGSHYDGGTANNPLPKKWLDGTWEQFIGKFIKKYPASQYCLTKEELLTNKKLKSFFGFKPLM